MNHEFPEIFLLEFLTCRADPSKPLQKKVKGVVGGGWSQEEGVGRERFGSALAGGPVTVGENTKCFWSLDLSKRRTKRGHGCSG